MRSRLLHLVVVPALVGWAGLGAASADSAEPAFRYRAPITVSQPAPFVELPLPPVVYGRAAQSGLRDLRIVDANDARVPFALLPVRPQLQTGERLHEAALYPLPARPVAGGTWPSPVDVVVEGDRISVHRHGNEAAAPGSSATPAARSGGWLIDTGELKAGDPRPQSLRLAWSGPAEFSAGFDLESSDDLRSWRSGGSGQVMALQSAAGALSQPLVALTAGSGRFVRLVWSDASAAPALRGATVVATEPALASSSAATELTFTSGAEPAGKAGAADSLAAKALHFDLGGDLPFVDLDLRFLAGTHVAPVRLQQRSRLDEPWRELGAAVFYRLERAGSVAESPAVGFASTARYLRIVADERAAALAPADVRLVVHATLPTLVFANQGTPPFRLLAGAADANAGALPIETLVPGFDDERARLGHASLGEFSEVPAVAQAAAHAEAQARLRPIVLWAVLGAGVLLLGALVWRLAKSGPAAPVTPAATAAEPPPAP